jgi:hypothetical protein
MCFSATASFTVAGALAGIGAVSVSREKEPSHRMMAVVPLLFAAQQVAEGVVWLTLERPEHHLLHRLAVAAFLGFAQVVWPAWVPLMLRAVERNPRRRKWLGVLSGVGVAVSLGAAIILFRGRPEAYVAGHSVSYGYVLPGRAVVLGLYLPMYFIPSVLPFFVSTMSKAKLMGIVLIAALVASYLIKRQTFTSVWCFFAAILSVILVLGISADRRLTIKVA